MPRIYESRHSLPIRRIIRAHSLATGEGGQFRIIEVYAPDRCSKNAAIAYASGGHSGIFDPFRVGAIKRIARPTVTGIDGGIPGFTMRWAGLSNAPPLRDGKGSRCLRRFGVLNKKGE